MAVVSLFDKSGPILVIKEEPAEASATVPLAGTAGRDVPPVEMGGLCGSCGALEPEIPAVIKDGHDGALVPAADVHPPVQVLQPSAETSLGRGGIQVFGPLLSLIKWDNALQEAPVPWISCKVASSAYLKNRHRPGQFSISSWEYA